MKRFILALLLGFCGLIYSFSQLPFSFKYQAVIRNSDGTAVKSNPIGLRISILQGSSTGIALFIESHSTTSNSSGVVSVNVGQGTPASDALDSIKWKNGPYFLKVEVDATGGTDYQLYGTSEILGNPYALFALSGNQGPKGEKGDQGDQGGQGIQGI